MQRAQTAYSAAAHRSPVLRKRNPYGPNPNETTEEPESEGIQNEITPPEPTLPEESTTEDGSEETETDEAIEETGPNNPI